LDFQKGVEEDLMGEVVAAGVATTGAGDGAGADAGVAGAGGVAGVGVVAGAGHELGIIAIGNNHVAVSITPYPLLNPTILVQLHAMKEPMYVRKGAMRWRTSTAGTNGSGTSEMGRWLMTHWSTVMMIAARLVTVSSSALSVVKTGGGRYRWYPHHVVWIESLVVDGIHTGIILGGTAGVFLDHGQGNVHKRVLSLIFPLPSSSSSTSNTSPSAYWVRTAGRSSVCAISMVESSVGISGQYIIKLE